MSFTHLYQEIEIRKFVKTWIVSDNKHWHVSIILTCPALEPLATLRIS